MKKISMVSALALSALTRYIVNDPSKGDYVESWEQLKR
jgi:hypothetical protein